ncbi:hypothetical protein FB567DRAFT_245063 [Paraphoma chrysanthemicola]|uniref:GED domain-containing protein n=1 Tax=Paraphoma chrysanthemicola TaxID=798071 RepID=A0A8K0VSK5_9PLEO|nr:hypothetical protein FB567DRAFT_245063 [Paraphoma chrysanthemicola]
MKNLSSIFSATLVADMDDAQLEAIAAESEVTRCERSKLRDELALLETGKQILSEHFAKAFVPSMQEARQESSQQVVQSRPRTPLVQPASQTSERPERAQGRGPETINDLTSRLNNLIVTPPPSGSNSRESSRRRVDSATTTPSKADVQRPRVRIQDVIERQPLEYDSDSEY